MNRYTSPITACLLSAGMVILSSACVAYVPPPGPIAYGPASVTLEQPSGSAISVSAPDYYDLGYYGPGVSDWHDAGRHGGWHGGGRGGGHGGGGGRHR